LDEPRPPLVEPALPIIPEGGKPPAWQKVPK
jgi:hypothetical protein